MSEASAQARVGDVELLAVERAIGPHVLFLLPQRGRCRQYRQRLDRCAVIAQAGEGREDRRIAGHETGA